MECVKEYHPIGTLYNKVLTFDLNSHIIRSLPIKLRISFKDEYIEFINLDADNNIRSPVVFGFLNKYMENLNNSYIANPMLFNVGSSPLNVGLKPVHYEDPKKQEKKQYTPVWNNQERPCKPCRICYKLSK